MNEQGYIGQTTRRAIEHALGLHKPIKFEEQPVGIDDLLPSFNDLISVG